MAEYNSIQSIITEFDLIGEPGYAITICISDILVRIRSNKGLLIDRLAEYFGRFLSSRKDYAILIDVFETGSCDIDLDFDYPQLATNHPQIKDEYFDFSDGRIIRNLASRVSFILTMYRNIAFGPCIDNLNQIVGFINNRYIEFMLARDGLLFHSSGVCHNGYGMAFSGFSGMGKSTLALKMMGYDDINFVSNDRLILMAEEDDQYMYGVPKMPRINPGTVVNDDNLKKLLDSREMAEFMGMPKNKLWHWEQKYDAPIDRVYGKRRFKLRSRIRSFVILNWTMDGGSFDINEIDLTKRMDLFPAFSKGPGLFYFSLVHQYKTPSFEDYIDGLSGVNIFEIIGGVDFDGAAAVCRGILHETAAPSGGPAMTTNEQMDG